MPSSSASSKNSFNSASASSIDSKAFSCFLIPFSFSTFSISTSISSSDLPVSLLISTLILFLISISTSPVCPFKLFKIDSIKAVCC